MATVTGTTKFALLKMSEEVRSKHANLKQEAKRTKEHLEEVVQRATPSPSESDSSNTDRSKKIWYLEKLVNVLAVQEKLLDNRVGCTFRTNEHYEEIMGEINKFQALIKEINEKCDTISL